MGLVFTNVYTADSAFPAQLPKPGSGRSRSLLRGLSLVTFLAAEETTDVFFF